MEPSELLASLVAIFDRLHLAHYLAGSIATSYFGEPRFTNDIDVIVEMDASDGFRRRNPVRIRPSSAQNWKVFPCKCSCFGIVTN